MFGMYTQEFINAHRGLLKLDTTDADYQVGADGVVTDFVPTVVTHALATMRTDITLEEHRLLVAVRELSTAESVLSDAEMELDKLSMEADDARWLKVDAEEDLSMAIERYEESDTEDLVLGTRLLIAAREQRSARRAHTVADDAQFAARMDAMDADWAHNDAQTDFKAAVREAKHAASRDRDESITGAIRYMTAFQETDEYDGEEGYLHD